MATVARSAVQIENAHLALKLVNRAEHDRNAVQRTRIVNEVARLVVVGAVDHQIVTVNLFQDIRRIELHLFGDKFDILVDILYFILNGSNFRAFDIAGTVKHLALQVFERNLVEIDDLDGPDTRRG